MLLLFRSSENSPFPPSSLLEWFTVDEFYTFIFRSFKKMTGRDENNLFIQGNLLVHISIFHHFLFHIQSLRSKHVFHIPRHMLIAVWISSAQP